VRRSARLCDKRVVDLRHDGGAFSHGHRNALGGASPNIANGKNVGVTGRKREELPALTPPAEPAPVTTKPFLSMATQPSVVRILTLAEGEISELHPGLKGTMNALFLKDLAQKTRRGLQGRVLQGLSGGGLCYGYDSIPGETGVPRINESEAKVVRTIFRDYAAGLSPRAIARKLNQQATPGPSGRPWRDTAIRGHFTRGTGILNNELYVGRLVWNRLTYLKDPTTGRRRSRRNLPEHWVVQHVTALRIIEDDLWQAVKARQGAIPRGPCAGNTFLGAQAVLPPAQWPRQLPAVRQPLRIDWSRLSCLLRCTRQRHLLQPSEPPPCRT